ncbi:MAG: alpha/beta fold hydrolase [Vulcanimicrobiota bacterium]
MKHRTFDLGSLSMHAVEAGEGPLVLLLHGFPACWYSWKDLIEPLSRHFRVVAPDLRGYNLSDRPKGVHHYTTDALGEDIARLVRALGETRAHIVGHDWGGALTWSLASTRPNLVDKVAVLNCPHPAAMLRHLRTNRRQLKRSWYIMFFQLPRLPEWVFSRRQSQFVKFAFAARRGTFEAEDLERYREAIFAPGALTAAINYYRAAGRQLLAPVKYPPIAAPSLLIWGERDKALGKELTFGMERYFSGDYRVEYLDAGHWVHNEQPERVLELLGNFLT